MSSAEAGPSTGSRQVTPPPSRGPRDLPATPEHVRTLQENRLKAKARIQAQAAAQFPQHKLNANGKRPANGPVPLEQPTIGPNGSLRSLPATSRNAHQDQTSLPPRGSRDSSSAAPPRKVEINPATGRPRLPEARDRQQRDDFSGPLPRDQSLGDYIEFDLSKLHNSKGGFLIDEDSLVEGGRKTVEEVRKERERERQRMRDAMEPGIVLDDREEICVHCQSKELNDQLRKVFGVKVCRSCERKLPELYSLLTKTEVKEDYLLTDPELRDPELLPHLLKANPHKSTYSNMMLFLRCQVEEYAYSAAKWGSEQGLDQEFERREEEKSRKRGKKFQDSLKELRKRTRDNVWQRRRDEEHRHEWVDLEEGEGGDGDAAGQDSGIKKQVCNGCGSVIEVEVF